MDTYGVEVDGALTGKIGVFFADIRDRILPFLRRQETLTLSNKSYHAELSHTLGDFRAKLVSTLAVVEELSRKGQETIQGRPFREILGKLIIPVDELIRCFSAIATQTSSISGKTQSISWQGRKRSLMRLRIGLMSTRRSRK